MRLMRVESKYNILIILLVRGFTGLLPYVFFFFCATLAKAINTPGGGGGTP